MVLACLSLQFINDVFSTSSSLCLSVILVYSSVNWKFTALLMFLSCCLSSLICRSSLVLIPVLYYVHVLQLYFPGL